MDNIDPIAAVTAVIEYGTKLASVFHNYSTTSKKVSRGFGGDVNILDTTLTILKQVLDLLNSNRAGNGKILFNENGMNYVKLLALECATVLREVQTGVEECCLGSKDRRTLAKQKRKMLAKKHDKIPDLLTWKLNEADFLEKVEKTKWSIAICDVDNGMKRLHEIQLHLLLVYQVGTVALLSRDVSSGKVDVQNIVSYHERVTRTASLVGLRVPKTSLRRKGSFSSISSFSSDTYSSDSQSSVPIRNKRKSTGGCRPPPPPPPPPPPRLCSAPGFRIGPVPPSIIPIPSCIGPVAPCSISSPEIIKPPAYSEGQKSLNNFALDTKLAEKEMNTASLAQNEKASRFSEEKPAGKEDAVSLANPEPLPKPKTPEGQLFSSKTNRLGFKIRSLFRSKESLAEEMRQTLSNANSQLTAFIIQRSIFTSVPHSVFHSLEATHMKSILSQLNDDKWYETYTKLNPSESNALYRILHPWVQGKVHKRELVVLKMIHQNKLNAWVCLLNEFLRNRPAFPARQGPVVLVVCREALVDGKPIDMTGVAIGLGPGIPVPPAQPSRLLREPPLPVRTPFDSSKISDLKRKPARPAPVRRHMPLPPAPPAAPMAKIQPKDAPPPSDFEALKVLTTYDEYTVRVCDPIFPNEPRSWSRVTITQESAERHLIQQRINQYEARGGNIIESKLRLTSDQDTQVTHIMDDIRSEERDARFDWCWAEISLYTDAGEVVDLRSAQIVKADITMMHLIAKRFPRPYYKYVDLYYALMYGSNSGPPRLLGPGLAPGLSPGLEIINTPPQIIKGMNKKCYNSDSDTSNNWSSEDSVGNVRRRMRRYRKRNPRNRHQALYNSDSDTDSEDEDNIKVDLKLKKGDSLVSKLLELWILEADVKDKEKGALI